MSVPSSLIGDRRCRKRRPHFLEILVAGDRAADRELSLDPRKEMIVGQQLLCDLGHCRRCEEDARIAVVGDIGDFARRKTRGNAGVVEPCPLRRPADLVEARIVVHEDGDGIARLQARIAEEMRQLVRSLLEFPVSHALARPRHDVGGFVGVGFRMGRRMHCWSSPGMKLRGGA